MRYLILLALVLEPASGLAPSCSGHGVWSVWHGTLGCFCDAGWTGLYCDKRVCDPACVHGSCDDGTCMCEQGWMGRACEERRCPGVDGGCSGHGTCVNGTCSCDLLFSGADCGLAAPQQQRVVGALQR